MIHLRSPKPTDRAGIHAFLHRLGAGAGDLDARRGRRFARTEPWAVVATQWTGTREQIVGLAAVASADGAPVLLAEDPHVVALLGEALATHAQDEAHVA